MTPATALRQARRRAGMSQRQLGQQAGVPQSTIGRIEAGLADPRINTLDRLLRICGEELESVPSRGTGVDRTVIRRRLAQTPRQRLEQAATDADAIARVRNARPVRR